MSVRKIITSSLFIMIIAAGAISVSAQWKQLGSKEVDYRVDHDTITVTMLRGSFSHIRLDVANAPVRFHSVVVTYSNGQTHQVALRSFIRAGSQTRAINLPGVKRFIRKVDFWYESASLGRRKARVTLYGRN